MSSNKAILLSHSFNQRRLILEIFNDHPCHFYVEVYWYPPSCILFIKKGFVLLTWWDQLLSWQLPVVVHLKLLHRDFYQLCLQNNYKHFQLYSSPACVTRFWWWFWWCKKKFVSHSWSFNTYDLIVNSPLQLLHISL